MHAFDGLHMPSRTRIFDRLSCAEKKGIDCPSVHFFLGAASARQTKVLKRKKPTSLEAGFSNSEWCPRRESNSHVFRQRFLRPPRLPFRHSGAKSNYTRCSRKRKPKFQSTRKKQRCRPKKTVRAGTEAPKRGAIRCEGADTRRQPQRFAIMLNRPETR